MALRDDISNAIKDAMKAGDKTRLGAARLILSELKNKDVEARGAGRTQAGDDELLALMQKMIKQRQESRDIYAANARPELAAQEQAEIDVIAGFLPQQMDAAAVSAAIAAAIAETGAATPKDMGKVIAALKAKFAGQMDFGKVSGMVKAALGG